ncbi:Pyridoxine/pyridoxal/pyridoxamine kinase [Ottowia pentelensis]
MVIDPVLGDEDHGEYVAPGMADAYRQHLLPLADGLTPNGFELARLSGMPVGTFDQVVAAARTLLTGRTQWIAVTSAAPATWTPGEIQVALVTRTQAQAIRHPRIAATPKGTGDLFCASLTARWLGGAKLQQAAEAACQQVVRALRLTRQAQSAELLLQPMASV